MRRTQQQQVYDAQEAVPLGRRFRDHDEVQQFLDELTSAHWWDPEIMRVEVQMLDVRLVSNEGAARWEEDEGAGVIGLKTSALNMRTVAHELAHIMADKNGSDGHDPLYCRAYLTTTYYLLGPDAFVALRASFERHGVVHDDEE